MALRRMGAAASKTGPMHFHVSPVHKWTGEIFCTITWLWMLYRAKEDGLVVLGVEHPWDHHGDHGDHAHKEYRFQTEEIGDVPTLVGDDDEDEDDH
eukprot:CAMPEP_0117758312 /NCGR_PEP_ID=MMETSP0947-20121206/15296_1 /TAXON_ID=44440 /ORGANISM="Chattonella subsalsa, Strain CCMP2191" /LENGTH=95 /DNA_ID=CAMNT_0005578461 /DNA_START=117 /DNA_END=404 /DNA_ORIENTATION=+